MIVCIDANEYRGKFSCKQRNVKTIAEAHSISELLGNYKNLSTANAILYSGDIDNLIVTMTPDNAKQIFIVYEVNPDVINLGLLDKLQEYNVLCRVPDGYNNMQHICTLSEMYPNLRFCGGYLLQLDGVRIGVFDAENPKRYIFKDKYGCQEDVVSLSNLDEKGVKYSFVDIEEQGVHIDKSSTKKPKADSKKRAKADIKKQPKFTQGGLSIF